MCHAANIRQSRVSVAAAYRWSYARSKNPTNTNETSSTFRSAHKWKGEQIADVQILKALNELWPYLFLWWKPPNDKCASRNLENHTLKQYKYPSQELKNKPPALTLVSFCYSSTHLESINSLYQKKENNKRIFTNCDETFVHDKTYLCKYNWANIIG